MRRVHNRQLPKCRTRRCPSQSTTVTVVTWTTGSAARPPICCAVCWTRLSAAIWRLTARRLWPWHTDSKVPYWRLKFKICKVSKAKGGRDRLAVSLREKSDLLVQIAGHTVRLVV
jgi:hypothetical protein